ncbi:putative structural protein [Erwinia phage pEa_SNUABM_47]|uniref:Putative structural protein n=1 Tax=Erwinia phage pEa_SNUABM_47 TaxID=2768774 RepID=A0A7L8ZMQ1_9CAUD|nr:putative structural protein [Erwinia phage pEa_SNUABM_47]
MANIKLLQEAIQAFANGNNEIADKKMRKYFVEQAQEINKKLEEEMESEEEEMCEDINSDPEESMTDEVGYKLDEEEELDEGMFSPDINAGGNAVNIGGGSANGEMQMEEDEHPEDSESDFEDEGSEDSASPDADQWESIKSAFEDLERMFDEIEGGDGVEFEDDQSDDFGDAEESEDEFGDVQFGDEKVGEAFQMKKVAAPEKTEKAGVNKKSVVAPNAKSPVDGVKPVTIKDGTVDATDDKFENSDALDAKVEDHNNVMDNGKHVMKPAKTPKNTAEKSRSPLPKSQPKI